jgi:hypothetical protein
MPTIPAQLRSRKLWLTVAAFAFVGFAREVGLDLDNDSAWQLVALVAAYVGGEGAADAVRAFRSTAERV